MWTALLGTEVIDLESMTPDAKRELRRQRRAALRCRGCKGCVHTRLLEDKADPFLVFAHNPGQAQLCRELGLGWDESPEHHMLKSRIASAGRRAGWNVELEVQPEPTCRADVVATRLDGKQWAFEAQIARLQMIDAVDRHKRYARAFGDCTWVHTRPREWSTRIPSLQIDKVEDCNVIAGIKTDPTGLIDAASQELSDVVPKVLNGSLTYVFLEDFGYYVDLGAQPTLRRHLRPRNYKLSGRYVHEACNRPTDIRPLIDAWLRWDRLPRSRETTNAKLDAIKVLGLNSSVVHEAVAAARHAGMTIPDAVKRGVEWAQVLRAANVNDEGIPRRRL